MNDKQEANAADDISYQELVVNIPPEVLIRIEEKSAERWRREFEEYAENAEGRIEETYQEMVRWRWLSTSLARKARIPDLISKKLMVPSEEEMGEYQKEQFQALLEKMELYLKMGQDFETLIEAIQSSDAIQNSWENLLVMMKLAGLDEKPEQ